MNYKCPEILKTFCKDKKPSTNFQIPLLSIREVGKLLSNLKNSSALGPDNVSVKIIKLIIPYITVPLTYIFNLCIQKNIFPSTLKEAKVIPLPKTKKRNPPPVSPTYLSPPNSF